MQMPHPRDVSIQPCCTVCESLWHTNHPGCLPIVAVVSGAAVHGLPNNSIGMLAVVLPTAGARCQGVCIQASTATGLS
jgi:hypothetical protein